MTFNTQKYLEDYILYLYQLIYKHAIILHIQY